MGHTCSFVTFQIMRIYLNHSPGHLSPPFIGALQGHFGIQCSEGFHQALKKNHT